MNKYLVSVDVSGYCRGYEVWEVEADSEEDAKEFYYTGNNIESEIIRDDRDREATDAEETKPGV